jgi:hypothetical protein
VRIGNGQYELVDALIEPVTDSSNFCAYSFELTSHFVLEF